MDVGAKGKLKPKRSAESNGRKERRKEKEAEAAERGSKGPEGAALLDFGRSSAGRSRRFSTGVPGGIAGEQTNEQQHFAAVFDAIEEAGPAKNHQHTMCWRRKEPRCGTRARAQGGTGREESIG